MRYGLNRYNTLLFGGGLWGQGASLVPTFNASSYWPFKVDANDSIGANNATLIGTASIAGGVLNLPGTGSYGVVSDDDSLDQGVFSITGCVKFSSIASTSMIVAKRDGTDRSYYGYLNASTGKMQFKIRLQPSPLKEWDCQSTTSLLVDTWYRFAWVYDKDGDKKLYLNNVDETNINVNDLGFDCPNVNSDVYIGSHSVTSETMTGNIVNVRYHPIALTSNQVSDIDESNLSYINLL